MHLVKAFTQLQIKKIPSKYILNVIAEMQGPLLVGTGMTLSGEAGMELKKRHGSQS
jgi:hypothetical protein